MLPALHTKRRQTVLEDGSNRRPGTADWVPRRGQVVLSHTRQHLRPSSLPALHAQRSLVPGLRYVALSALCRRGFVVRKPSGRTPRDGAG